MRSLFLLFFLANFVVSTAYAPCRTPTANPGGTVLSEAALRKVLTDTCNQVNAFYKTKHFLIPAPSPYGCSFSYQDDPYYKVKTGKFERTYTSGLDAKMVATSGTVISFQNWDAFHAAYGPTAPLFSQRPSPQWTKTHAIEIATKFADIFVKPWKVKLGEPSADFNWPFGDVPKVAAGQWRVKWPRVSSSGIPFNSNGVNVTLSEKYGPDGIELGLAAEYDDLPITPIAQDKALIEARKGLDKILAWGPAKSRLPGAQIVRGNPLVRLLIVQPNDMTVQKSVLDAALSNQLKARMAWVVTFGVGNPANPNIYAAVRVYIDAKDGSFLGGYF